MSKTAFVRVSLEVLRDVIGILDDAGVRVIGTRDSDLGRFEAVLVVMGDALPDCCADRPHWVTVNVTTEAYGRQRIHRVSEIRIVEPAA